MAVNQVASFEDENQEFMRVYDVIAKPWMGWIGTNNDEPSVYEGSQPARLRAPMSSSLVGWASRAGTPGAGFRRFRGGERA